MREVGCSGLYMEEFLGWIVDIAEEQDRRAGSCVIPAAVRSTSQVP